MTSELVYTVHPGKAERAKLISLAEAGLRERADLQEWVRANPEIVGSDVKIVTFEFGSWQSRDGPASDRLDLLGLDTSGRLVVAELKRGVAPDTVEMQAIKYAAFASRFSPDSVADSYAAYMSKESGTVISSAQSHAALEGHASGPLDPDLIRRPRIVLLAAGFSSQVTASVVWLTEMGLDISLVQFNAYKTENDLVLTVSQIWPVPDVEEFTVSPRQAEVRAVEERAQHRREDNTVTSLISEGILEDGTELRISIPRLPPQYREAVAQWVGQEPRRALAEWRNQSRKPLVWKLDESLWSPTGLAKEIAFQASGERPPVVAGPRLWITPDGSALADLVSGRPHLRDWSDLHHVLETLQAGEWTSYGDLAEAIGSSARAVGQHVADCMDGGCDTAYRVLNSDGRVASEFRWGDPSDKRSPRAVLEAEGVRFEGDFANPEHRVSARELFRRCESAD